MLDVIKEHIVDERAFTEATTLVASICSHDEQTKIPVALSESTFKISVERIPVVFTEHGPLDMIYSSQKRKANAVCHVLPDSIAVRSGVRPDDILMSVNGRSVQATTCLVKDFDKRVDTVSLELQEALLPANRPLKVVFLRSNHIEKRLAIQQNIIAASLRLISAQRLSIEKVIGCLFSGPLNDAFLADTLRHVHVNLHVFFVIGSMSGH